MNLEILWLIGVILFMIVVLIKGADLIQESFVFISSKVQISTFFTGFVILGLASNLPELAIAITSSNTVSELSLGNLLGSSLIALTFIVGLSAVKFGDLNFKGRFKRREVIMSLLVIFLMVVVLIDKNLSVLDGIILIVGYGLVVLDTLMRFSQRNLEDIENAEKVSSQRVYKLITEGLIGIVLLLISANVIVDSVLKLGELVSINHSLVGILVLSIGTNTPEIAILIRAQNLDEKKLAYGNFMGSAFVISLIMGILAILSGGFAISNIIVLIPVLVIITFSVLLFGVFSWTGKEINKREGYMLIAAYLSMFITEAIIIFGKL